MEVVTKAGLTVFLSFALIWGL